MNLPSAPLLSLPSICPLVGQILGLLCVLVAPSSAITINGFTVDDTAVPVEHLVRATPAKDSILSIDHPAVVATEACSYLVDTDEVVSVTLDGVTRAYPLRILVWHEVVNDMMGDAPIVVTYSALTGSTVVFASGHNHAGDPRSFGVSGILYNSGLLFYDRETESLWSQLKMMGISNDYVAESLEVVVSQRMPWAAWRALYPEGQVISLDTGFNNDYLGDWPYGDYATQSETIFPFDVNPDRNEFTTKEPIIGFCEGESARAWAFRDLQSLGEVLDVVGGRAVKVRYVAAKQDAEVIDLASGEQLAHLKVFWFAWQAFYPETTVWQPQYPGGMAQN